MEGHGCSVIYDTIPDLLEELRKPLKSSVWIPSLGIYLNLEHPEYEELTYLSLGFSTEYICD
jgi:hypothetical protein